MVSIDSEVEYDSCFVGTINTVDSDGNNQT